MRRVTVRWVDSSTQTGWQEKPEFDLFECETTGYLAGLDKKAVVVCLNRALTASRVPMGEAVTIPRVAVKSIKYITEPKRGR